MTATFFPTRVDFGLFDAGRAYAVVPWQMGLVARLLRLLPNALFDRVIAGKARKPRAACGQKT